MKGVINLPDENFEIDFRDYSITKKEDDKLEFEKFAQNYSDFLKKIKLPFCFGLFGDWGSGKTTIMNFMKDYLSKDNKVVTVWFDSWKYENYDNLLFPLMCEISNRAPEEKKNNVNEFIRETLIPGFLKMSNQVIKIASNKLIGKEIDLIELLQQPRTKEQVYGEIEQNYEKKKKIEEEYVKVIDELLKEGEKEKVFIFIDDLDRCLPEKTIELFETIKNFLTKEGCKVVYIIGVDDKVVNSAIMAKYGEVEDFDGYKYLEKIFQFYVNVPRVDVKSLFYFHMDKMSYLIMDARIKDNKVEFIKKSIYKLLRDLDFRNPRMIKKIIYRLIYVLSLNTLDTLNPFGELSVEGGLFFQQAEALLNYYVIAIFIKENYPIFYRKILEKKYKVIESRKKFIEEYDKIKSKFPVEQLNKTSGFINREDYKTIYDIDPEEKYIEEEFFRKAIASFNAIDAHIGLLKGQVEKKDFFIDYIFSKI